MGTTYAQAFAQAVAERGCAHVFGLMGDGNMRLFVALRQRGIEVVEVRHESAAVAMAEGYTWSSGHTGICSVTHGPGLSHVATSLLVAGRNRSPLVVLAAETPAGYTGAQTFDQAAFAASCEVAYRRMEAGESPADVLDEVIALAQERSAPVVLGVAADLLASPLPTPPPNPVPVPVPTENGVTRARTARPARPADDDRGAAERLCGLLTASSRPVLIAGRGALAASAATLMADLAEHVGAGLATTLPAKGLFDGHPLDLGISGGLAHPAAERILGSADLVVGIGTSMGRSTTQSGHLFADAQVVTVVHEGRAGGKSETLRGDAAGTLEHALALIGTAMGPREPWFTPVGPSADCWKEDLSVHAPPIPDGTVDPRQAVMEISTHIPQDAIVVISNGHCSGFAAAFVTAPPQGRFFAAQGFGSIGQALPTAVGVALGAPGRKVVVFEGDAAFMMHAQEVETAARAGANLTAFVLNDEALGTEYQRLHKEGSDAEAAIVPPPDLARLASALGARSWTIAGDGSPGVAATALSDGLSVVDVRTARTVLSRHMRLPHTRSDQKESRA